MLITNVFKVWTHDIYTRTTKSTANLHIKGPQRSLDERLDMPTKTYDFTIQTSVNDYKYGLLCVYM